MLFYMYNTLLLHLIMSLNNNYINSIMYIHVQLTHPYITCNKCYVYKLSLSSYFGNTEFTINLNKYKDFNKFYTHVILKVNDVDWGLFLHFLVSIHHVHFRQDWTCNKQLILLVCSYLRQYIDFLCTSGRLAGHKLEFITSLYKSCLGHKYW